MERGSYLLLEPGMTVQGRDGELGTIAEVVADAGADIFRGIVLSPGLFAHAVFVPGEHITAVENNIATVDLTRDEARGLEAVVTGGG